MNVNVKSEKNLSAPVRINIKTIIIIVLFAVGLYFLLPKLLGAGKAIELLDQANKWYIVIAFVLEIASYSAIAVLIGVILSQLGYKIKFWDRYKIGSLGAFAIHFLPIGSFGQAASDLYFLRKKNVADGSILIMMVLRLLILYCAFLLIFIIGLALVPTVPNLPFSPRLISYILLFLIIGGLLFMIYLYKNKNKFRKSWNRFLRFGDFFLSKIRGREISKEKELEIFERIYEGIGKFGRKKRSTVYAVLAASCYWLGDIAAFYFVFLSFGYNIHWGPLIAGYCISSFLGMVSFIPGGLGVVEGSMGLIYAGLGVPSSIAIMAILVFRFFSFWIWIPFGIYSFVSMSKEKK